MKCDACNGEGYSWIAIGNVKERAQCHTCEGEGTIPDKYTPAELLRILLKNGFYRPSTGGIEWSFTEGTTIAEIMGNDVENALLYYFE